MRRNRAKFLTVVNKYVIHTRILIAGLQPFFGQNALRIGYSDICLLSGHKILLNIISYTRKYSKYLLKF